MRRKFKPSLRAEYKSIKKQSPAPDDEVDFEIIVTDGNDTVLNYEGSPLANDSFVGDPKEAVITPGNSNSYQNENWIAIGLATDNIEGANNDVVTGGPNAGQPIDGSGGVYHPVGGSQASGLVYTQIGPTRGVLMFDLSVIPPNAIIEEATLELTPEVDQGDVFFQGTNNNYWPVSGVVCEILNLPTDVEPSCTWNAKSDATINVPSAGIVPDPTKRWWRSSGGELLPNAIGVAQNTRRSDTGEPFETFIEQATIDSVAAAEINGDGDEYYGHIGYGFRGGGYAVNIDPTNLNRPTFTITKDHWDNPEEADTFIVDVKSAVEYSVENQGGECNLLLRASHWEANNIESDIDGQLTYPEEQIPELSFENAWLSDTAGAPQSASISEIEQSETLHVNTDIVHASAIVYQWQLDIPYTQISDIGDITTTGDIKEDETVEVQLPLSIVGGDSNNNIDSFEWSLNGTVDSSSTSATYSIPSDAGGKTLRVKISVSNIDPAEPGYSEEFNLGQVAVDGVGEFTFSSTPSGNSINELENAEVTITSVTGVNSPTFDYIWDYEEFVGNEQEELNTTDTSSNYTTPEIGGNPIFAVTCTINMYEGTGPERTLLQTKQKQWFVQNVTTPPTIQERINGIYSVTNMNVAYNIRSDETTVSGQSITDLLDEDTRAPGKSALKSARVEELQQPEQCVGEFGFDGGMPFGKKKDGNNQVDIVPGEDDLACFIRFQRKDSAPSQPYHGTFNSGLLKYDDQTSFQTHERVDLITNNGLNSIIGGTPRNGIGSLAIWFPTIERWVVFDARGGFQSSARPLKGGYDSTSHDPNDYVFGYQQASLSGFGYEGVGSSCIRLDDHIAWSVSSNSSIGSLGNYQDWSDIIGLPENNTDLGNLTFVFFDAILESPQVDSIESGNRDFLTTLQAAENTEEIALPDTSFASGSHTDAAAIEKISHVTWEIDNLTNIQPQDPANNSCWLEPDNFNIDDSQGEGYLRRGIPSDEIADVTDEEWRNITGDVDGSYNGISYNNIQLGYINKSDDGWSQYTTVSVTYMLTFIGIPLPPSKNYVFEHIRDGVIKHRCVFQHEENADGKVGVLYPLLDPPNYTFCNSSNWQVNDLFVISIINSDYSFDVIENND